MYLREGHAPRPHQIQRVMQKRDANQKGKKFFDEILKKAYGASKKGSALLGGGKNHCILEYIRRVLI